MERRIDPGLFADLVGFTALSELLDADDLAAVQDAYFAGVRDVVERNGGRLETFIGDADGRPQLQAWARCGAAEAGLLLGEWDEAFRRGREALAIALPNGDHRVTVRSWSVLRPIALLRGDDGALRELGAWAASLTDLPDSPYGRLMHTAVEVSVAAGTGGTVVDPDPDRLRDAWALAYGEASFVAARDAVLQAWWDAGRFEEVIEAVALLPVDEAPGPLAVGAAALWRARLGGDESVVVDEARRALVLAGRWGAAWWMEQAIGILDDAGDATPEERALRRSIRIRLLGVPPG